MARPKLSPARATDGRGADRDAADDGIGWEFGGYYLDIPHRDRGGSWYACRYEGAAARSRIVRRRSLSTKDLGEAKRRLIALVAKAAAPPDEAPHPRDVMTLQVVEAYLEGHATTIRAEEQAIRSAGLVAEWLRDVVKDAAAPLAFWSPSRQKQFAEWLRDAKSHRAGTIERVFNDVAAAFNDAARVKMRPDPMGGEIEGALVSHAPQIVMRRGNIARDLKMQPARKGGYTPSLVEMARMLDAIETRHLRRWAIMALCTWGRSEAILDFDPDRQIDPRTGLLDLNPPSRIQTNKHRPRILATRCLIDWLPVWRAEDIARETRLRGTAPTEPPALLVYKGVAVRSVKRGVSRIGDRIDLPQMTPRSFRRFMPTMVKRMCGLIPRERRSMWLGHSIDEGSKTTDHYEAFDPEALRSVALATDFVMLELQKLCATRLFAIEPLLKSADLRAIGAKPRKKSELISMG